MNELYYFGCMRETGHCLWRDESSKVYSHGEGPPYQLMIALDGAFTPQANKYQQWQLSVVGPWTIVSWWDCSVDKRPNSCSSFIGKGYGSEPHRLLADAFIKFPTVFSRQPTLSEWKP